MAARLREVPGVQVQMEKGGLGELRVTLDGADVFAGSRLWYPRTDRVVAEVRRHLSA